MGGTWMSEVTLDRVFSWSCSCLVPYMISCTCDTYAIIRPSLGCICDAYAHGSCRTVFEGFARKFEAHKRFVRMLGCAFACVARLHFSSNSMQSREVTSDCPCRCC